MGVWPLGFRDFWVFGHYVLDVGGIMVFSVWGGYGVRD